MVEVEQGKALEHPWRRGHPSGMWVEAVAHWSFLPTGRGGGGNWIGDGVLRRGEGFGGWRQSGVGVEGVRKLGSTVPREKAARGGEVLGLRSPWRVSRRWRRLDSGGGALGQGHDAQMATWSASGTGGGAVRTACAR
jgi:hypothetical protein